MSTQQTFNPYETFSGSNGMYGPWPGVDTTNWQSEADPAKRDWLRIVEYSGILKTGYLTSAAREWIKIPPVGREAKLFPSLDRDRKFFGIWKTDKPNQTVNSPRAQIQSYLYWPDTPEYYELNQNAPRTRALMLAKTYQAWNSALDFYVIWKGIAPADAITVIRRDDSELAKATIEFVGMLPAGTIGLAKSSKTVAEMIENISDPAKKLAGMSEDLRKKLFPTEKEKMEKKMQQELEAAQNMEALSKVVHSAKSALDTFGKSWGLWQ